MEPLRNLIRLWTLLLMASLRTRTFLIFYCWYCKVFEQHFFLPFLDLISLLFYVPCFWISNRPNQIRVGLTQLLKLYPSLKLLPKLALLGFLNLSWALQLHGPLHHDFPWSIIGRQLFLIFILWLNQDSDPFLLNLHLHFQINFSFSLLQASSWFLLLSACPLKLHYNSLAIWEDSLGCKLKYFLRFWLHRNNPYLWMTVEVPSPHRCRHHQTNFFFILQ